MGNKHADRRKFRQAKIREIVRYFAAELTALQAAQLARVNRFRCQQNLPGAALSASTARSTAQRRFQALLRLTRVSPRQAR
jgi:endonuclease/exonuclease/phosphatase family metal-dependent hydrolase